MSSARNVKSSDPCSLCGVRGVFVAEVKRDMEVWSLLCRKCYMGIVRKGKDATNRHNDTLQEQE